LLICCALGAEAVVFGACGTVFGAAVSAVYDSINFLVLVAAGSVAGFAVSRPFFVGLAFTVLV
jgi:hypothetical protein